MGDDDHFASFDLEAPHNQRAAAEHVFKVRNDIVRVSFCVSPQLKDTLANEYFGWSFQGAINTHTHPLLAMDRRYVEELCYRFMASRKPKNAWILDVGGKGRRHQRFNRRNIWSCEPHISPDDFIISAATPPHTCAHEAKFCDCKPIYSLFFSQTLYYHSVQNLVLLLDRSQSGEAIAIVANFPDAFGCVGEGTYVRQNEDVTFVLNGQPFRHSACDWLLAGRTGYGKFTVKAFPVFNTKYSAVYLLKLERTAFCPLISTSIVDVLSMDKHVGPVSVTFGDGMQVAFNVTSIHSCFGWLYLRADDQCMVVNKKMFADLSVYMLGRPRTQHTFQVLLAKTKQLVSRYPIPDSHRHQVVMATCHAAFFLNCETEFGMLNGNLIKHAGAIDKFNNSLGFRTEKPYWFLQARILSNSVLNLFSAFKSALTDTVQEAANDLLGQLNLLNKHIMFGERQYDRAFDEGDYAMPSKTMTYKVESLPLIETTCEPTLSQLDVTSFVRIDEYVDVKPIVGQIVPLGIVVPSYPPIAYASTQQNEIVSVVNRAMAPKIPIHQRTFKEFTEWAFCDSNWSRLFPEAGEEMEDERPSFSRWTERYDLAKQAKHLLARERLPTSIHEQCNAYTNKVFVKTEKLLKAQPGTINHTDPRTISGCDDEYNVIVGPHILALQNKLKRIWGKDHFIYFTSGASAETIGKWLPGTQDHYLENDFSRFDSSIGKALLLFEIQVMLRLGLNADVARVMKRNINCPGRTAHGVYYYVEGTRKSGTPHTSMANSLLNGLEHAFLMEKNNKIVDYSMLVMGDDNLLKFSTKEGGNFGVKDLNLTLFKQLGHSAKPKFYNAGEEHALEFCSSRFYPVESTEYILGPKIGRTLAKFGWFIRPPQSSEQQRIMLRGVLLSKQFDFQYIPILRVFWDTMMRATSTHSAANDRANFYNYKATAVEHHEVDPRIYTFIELVYGLSKDQCDFLEHFLSLPKELPVAVNHPLIDMCIEVDL